MGESIPLSRKHQHFLKAISTEIDPSRIITDPLRTLAFGTNTCFYRLIQSLALRPMIGVPRSAVAWADKIND